MQKFTFDIDKLKVYLVFLQSQKIQLNSHLSSKTLSPYELAILFKRFELFGSDVLSKALLFKKCSEPYLDQLTFLEKHVNDAKTQYMNQVLIIQAQNEVWVTPGSPAFT